MAARRDLVRPHRGPAGDCPFDIGAGASGYSALLGGPIRWASDDNWYTPARAITM